MLFVMRVLFPPEYQEVHAEHIEGGEACYHGHPGAPEPVALEHGCQHFVFAEEAREGVDTCNGQTAYKEGDMADRHVFGHASHGGIVV